MLPKLLAYWAGSYLARRFEAWAAIHGGTPQDAADRLPPLRFRRPVPSAVAGGAAAAIAVAGLYLGWTALQSRDEARAVAIALTHGDPDRAPGLITRYGCGGCHTIPGARGADGMVAPPLTEMRQRVFVAGVLRNTPENLVAWIVDPPAFSPRTAMPVTGISEAEARDVAAFLYSR